uniref:Uncharacterized protein n=1 Tax=Rhizophora mucronata TaxID=61149 RepID=A0A2P2KGQ8_RHIMU
MNRPYYGFEDEFPNGASVYLFIYLFQSPSRCLCLSLCLLCAYKIKGPAGDRECLYQNDFEEPRDSIPLQPWLLSGFYQFKSIVIIL